MKENLKLSTLFKKPVIQTNKQTNKYKKQKNKKAKQ